MRVTINKINERLPKGYELIKGNGYFYFIGCNPDGSNDCAGWHSSSVLTCHLNGQSIDAWIDNFYDFPDNENER